jgi:hypothetical protein
MTRQWRPTRPFAVAIALIALLAACEPAPVVIPQGAQVVRVAVTDETVQIAPRTVRAGDVYFVNEGPEMGFSIISRMAAGDAGPTGMTQAQIDALAAGDFQSTQQDGLSVSCGADEWTEARHWQGCRENGVRTLGPGFYAILGPGGDEPGVPPVMDVLEVVP